MIFGGKGGRKGRGASPWTARELDSIARVGKGTGKLATATRAAGRTSTNRRVTRARGVGLWGTIGAGRPMGGLLGGLFGTVLVRPLVLGATFIGQTLLQIARVVVRPTAAMLTSLAVCVVVALAARAVYRSGHFAVRNVVIDTHAAAHLTEPLVRRNLGLKLGGPIFGLDAAAVAARVRSNPWVEDVAVHRQLPSTVVVSLRERRPVALVLLGALYLVDASGVPFKRAALDETAGLPVITGIDRHTYRFHPDVGTRLVREALAALAAYSAEPGRPKLAELRIDEPQGVSLFTYQGGVEIRLGRDGYGAKLARFDALRRSLRRGPMSLRAIYLDDDRWTDRVVIRPADGEDTGTLLVDRSPLTQVEPGAVPPLRPPGRPPSGFDGGAGRTNGAPAAPPVREPADGVDESPNDAGGWGSRPAMEL